MNTKKSQSVGNAKNAENAGNAGNGAGGELVREYLAAVEREASALPAERRQELVADLAEHIEVALTERPESCRDILRELGDPRTMAATAFQESGFGPGQPPAPSPPPAPVRGRRPDAARPRGSWCCCRCSPSASATSGFRSASR
ncbi:MULTISPECIES: HAAS signaling domain-containing protein [unclassified Streptomyces]|uniref:HAAS signaling domain-containing protein n=1 Tax=unclassified Streptomyces TaxID=2593676 RepID=UPI002E77A4E6|nr:hypothetical protein [Streptomyces sp. JV184]MEE1746683.1 hypothetical protein [Streptomyces sp. JV184]